MPFDGGGIGAKDDTVRLRMNGADVLIAESWDMDESIFHTPAAWTMRLGSSENAKAILDRFPKGCKAEIFVGNVLQLTGRLDGRHCGGSGGATQVTLKGRDALAQLHDSGTDLTRSFRDSTYSEFVKWALEQAGLDPALLKFSNFSNRKLKAGIPIAELEAAVFSDVVNQETVANKGESVGQIVQQDHQTKVDESLLSFVRRLIDRAGIMLWAGAEGDFILGLPNAKQAPSYRLIRRIKKSGVVFEGGNIVDYEFIDDATHRHANAVVFGKHGGRHSGRGHSKGAYVDEDLSNPPNIGYVNTICYRDVEVRNVQQAEFYARRKLAEERREGWQLNYTISGHTLPAVATSERAVVTYDTTIHVVDEVLGIDDVMYVEGVRRQRSPETTTALRLMRKSDLVLGGDG